MVCSLPRQADGAATTPTVGKRSNRSRTKAPDFAAGPGSGEKKPKYATDAARKEAQKNRKKEQARYKKEEKDQQQQDRGT